MVDMDSLLEMQGMMFCMVLIGMLLAKKKIITPEAKKSLTDITINLLIPCNMFAAFLNADHSMITQMMTVMLVSLMIQIGCYTLSKILFRKMDDGKRSVMRYGTMVSNAGFLGNPMVEGMYGSQGLLLASVFLVPVRLFYWTVGLACFVPVDKKNVVKTALTHPCIIAVILGLLYMFFPVPLPVFVTKTITGFSSAMTPVTMLLIGAILAEVDLRTIVCRETLYMSLLRLVILPGIVLAGVKLAGLPELMASVSVILIAMPVATTTAILAARYDRDYQFATKTVVLTTILSLFTIPVWSIVVGQVL
ncbi:AEC family transporter [Cuneatibacter sp. NSJ-177]|uniref:AEC family transporter n=1 Tax=Cuneatibacter sp. NSJ-177 TaxID=2931401 RepID=UPI001FD3018C|nr:AEC family transporter [Cuneatibacter sp. NSJ-177]MCJ7837080.1 AEC family transporter [Cuneatibacter sp. NSJ-177]